MSSIPQFPFSRSRINEICYKCQQKFLFCLSFRSSLGLSEQGCVDLRRVLQCSSKLGQAQLPSPPPEAHAVASHAAPGTQRDICQCLGHSLKLYLLKFFFIISPLDGSDVIQQWSQFNMGALPSGPSLSDERKTESQPSGQAAVSGRCSVVMAGCFVSI